MDRRLMLIPENDLPVKFDHSPTRSRLSPFPAGRAGAGLGVLLVALAGTTGCGGDDTSSPTQPGTSGSTTDMTGDWLSSYVWSAGTGEVGTAEVAGDPPDPNESFAEALVRGEDGSWESIRGTLNADWSFRIPSVPEGPAYLHLHLGELSDWYWYGTARTFHLGATIGGRPELLSNTEVNRLDNYIDNLAPVGERDFLSWANSNEAGRFPGLFSSFWSPGEPSEWDANPPALGATSLVGTQPAFAAIAPVDGQKGDELHVFQYVHGSSPGGVDVWTLNRFLRVGDLVQTPGALTRVQGTMEDISTQQSLALKVLGSRFETYGEAVHPTASVVSFNAVVAAARVNDFTSYRELAVMADTAPVDQDLGTLRHGNPFSSDYKTFVSVEATYRIAVPIPGEDATYEEDFTTNLWREAAAADGQAIAPGLSPPRALQINGVDALSAPESVTLTPTLSWEPPEEGTATLYNASIGEFRKESGEWLLYPVFSSATDETSLPLPPGVLVQGKQYIIYLVAIGDPATSLGQPEQTSFNRDTSMAVSAVFTP